MKKILAGLLLLTLFALLVNAETPWLPGYPYVDTINITENSGTNLTDYQVLVVVNSSLLISEGKMNGDCSDIRFTEYNSTDLLSYWIESGCNTSLTNIWVNVPLIPASSITKIYMHHGNASAASESDGEDVFEFFDDFETNLSKWAIEEQCSSAHVVRNSNKSVDGDYSAYIYTTQGNCRAFMKLYQNFTEDIAIEWDWAPKGGSLDYQVFYTFISEGGGAVGNIYARDATSPYNFEYYNGSSYFTLSATYTSDMQWRSISERYSFATDTYDIYVDGTLKQENAVFRSSANSIGYLYLYSGAGVHHGYQYVDRFRVRKYVSPEPTAVVV